MAWKMMWPENFSNDPRIIPVRRKHGWQGFGIAVAMLELCRSQADAKLKFVPEDLSWQLQVEPNVFLEIIETATDSGLFEVMDGVLSSPVCDHDLAEYNARIQSFRDRGRKGAEETNRKKGGKAAAKPRQAVSKLVSKLVSRSERSEDLGESREGYPQDAIPEDLPPDNLPVAPTKAKPFQPESLPLPPELNTPEVREAWQRWCQHRREIKKPLTPTSAQQQLETFRLRGPDALVAAITNTIRHGWQGLRDPEPERTNRSPDASGPLGIREQRTARLLKNAEILDREGLNVLDVMLGNTAKALEMKP